MGPRTCGSSALYISFHKGFELAWDVIWPEQASMSDGG